MPHFQGTMESDQVSNCWSEHTQGHLAHSRQHLRDIPVFLHVGSVSMDVLRGATLPGSRDHKKQEKMRLHSSNGAWVGQNLVRNRKIAKTCKSHFMSCHVSCHSLRLLDRSLFFDGLARASFHFAEPNIVQISLIF